MIQELWCFEFGYIYFRIINIIIMMMNENDRFEIILDMKDILK